MVPCRLVIALASSVTLAVTVGPTALAAPAYAPLTDQQRAPGLRVKTVVGGADLPWDLTFLPSGAMLYTERERIIWRGKKGASRVLAATPRGVWHASETGMMSVLAARNFVKSRAFYTCYGGFSHGRHDVRVVRWRLNSHHNGAHRTRVLVKNLPSTTGRHGGCRLRFGAGGALFVGTGDAITGTNPQNLKSGGGKVLRVSRKTGRGLRSNPFSHANNAMKRRVFTYGHRNVQGLALRKGGRMWSVEHGPDRDDEVNLLRKAGNYGWNPVPGYNESVPMTDHSLPGRQLDARWSSGYPTLATSGATWVSGRRWGAWQGCLAVATLKDSSLRILKFTKAGKFVRMWTPNVLDGAFGRLRSVVMGPHNALYVTTSNGGNGAGGDRILKVTPTS